MKISLTKKEYNDAYNNLIKKSDFDFDFIILILSATIICSLGIELNNLTVIIGSMLISPLLYPIIAISSSFIRGDFKNFFRFLEYVFISVLIIILISAIISFIFPIEVWDNVFVEKSYKQLFFYFLVAYFSGFSGTFCFFWPGIIEAIAGIAISIALLPPICILGLSLIGNFNLFLPALFFVFCNFAGIFLGSLTILVYLNIRKK